MEKEEDLTELVIPKSDTESGPGLVRLNETLPEQTNPLLTFNEHN